MKYIRQTSDGALHEYMGLLKLGIEVSQATVSMHMTRHPNRPSQIWRTFLDNHVPDLVSVDFFTVPTATFRVLFVFIALRYERREIAHCNLTEHPTALWTTQQIVDAFPFGTAPRDLLRARDRIYGDTVQLRIESLVSNHGLQRPDRLGKILSSNV